VGSCVVVLVCACADEDVGSVDDCDWVGVETEFVDVEVPVEIVVEPLEVFEDGSVLPVVFVAVWLYVVEFE
jgi:hypothetical protein